MTADRGTALVALFGVGWLAAGFVAAIVFGRAAALADRRIAAMSRHPAGSQLRDGPDATVLPFRPRRDACQRCGWPAESFAHYAECE